MLELSYQIELKATNHIEHRSFFFNEQKFSSKFYFMFRCFMHFIEKQELYIREIIKYQLLGKNASSGQYAVWSQLNNEAKNQLLTIPDT